MVICQLYECLLLARSTECLNRKTGVPTQNIHRQLATKAKNKSATAVFKAGRTGTFDLHGVQDDLQRMDCSEVQFLARLVIGDKGD